MLDFNEFCLNESSFNKEEILKYIDTIKEHFVDNGFNKVTILFDNEENMILSATLNLSINMFENNNEFIKLNNFIQDMKKICVDKEIEEQNDKKKFNKRIFFVFNCSKGLPLYFKSLKKVNDFNL